MYVIKNIIREVFLKMSNSIVRKELRIEFEKDTEKLKQQITELEKLKKIILDSPEFKLLDGKTQLNEKFTKNEQSRGEHSSSVAAIAKRLIGEIYEKSVESKIRETERYKLNKKVAQLYAEVTGCAHDIGHTPFGHVGENALNEFMENVSNKREISSILEKRKKIFGESYEKNQGHTEGYDGNLSFEHNEQSAIVFYDIANRNNIDTDLIDVDRIIKGILTHSVSRVSESNIPNDIVVQSIRMADKIAYVNEDFKELEGDLKFDLEDDMNLVKFVSKPYDKRIKEIINNLSSEAVNKGYMDDHMSSMEVLRKLKKINDGCICLLDADGKRGLVRDENAERIKEIVFKIANYYYAHPGKIPTKKYAKISPINENKEKVDLVSFDSTKKTMEQSLSERVIDYISSFDNKMCMKKYMQLVKDRIIYGEGHGITPVRAEDIEKRKQEQIDSNAIRIMVIEQKTMNESRAIVTNNNQNYIKNRLTNEALKKMIINRQKHEEEQGEDDKLRDLMEEADELRRIGRNEFVTRIIPAYFQSNKKGFEEKRDKFEKNWKKQDEFSK